MGGRGRGWEGGVEGGREGGRESKEKHWRLRLCVFEVSVKRISRKFQTTRRFILKQLY